MLKLSEEDIFLGCKASTKNEAIKIAADALQKSGYVSSGFYQAMLERDKELSTYVGSGVALPHCAKKYIHLVSRTGFQIFQFPDGVNWGEGKIAFLVVAVAAKKDEHIKVLASIADLLDDEVKTTLLGRLTGKAEFIRQFVKT
ncbi:PTS sugar transporter subunit IIA [Martelella alba]|uniref:PTS sugar transporter subunit IIA n=1 Tax=Martelella alba TaxID=2590451 RepID=A0ABY2SG90_9HYPH|nr:PTS sugar transporter subunit IIA [Martelella alba]TKI03012.1 PTS sugar transporter subunit IIA [Martelella alba]